MWVGGLIIESRDLCVPWLRSARTTTLRDISDDTRQALIRAIGEVKILDPACGSGAYPMGALHRLVDLLDKLDPKNKSWKRQRLEAAQKELEWMKSKSAATDRIIDAEAQIADIERSFDIRFHALDYARKLYLIENSIYGVDIQPIAVQIANYGFHPWWSTRRSIRRPIISAFGHYQISKPGWSLPIP